MLIIIYWINIAKVVCEKMLSDLVLNVITTKGNFSNCKKSQVWFGVPSWGIVSRPFGRCDYLYLFLGFLTAQQNKKVFTRALICWQNQQWPKYEINAKINSLITSHFLSSFYLHGKFFYVKTQKSKYTLKLPEFLLSFQP